MPASNFEIQRRKDVALAAIRKAHGTTDDACNVSLFVSHHLDELGSRYWIEQCGEARPTPEQILDILVFESHWSCNEEEVDDDGIDNFDFTLPGQITNYLISVSFNEDGEVSGVSMES